MTREIINRLQAISYILEVTLLSGDPGNRKWCQDLAQSLNIKLLYETTQDMVWLHSFLEGLGISSPSSMPMYSDNQAAIFIIENFSFHERTMRMIVIIFETRLCLNSFSPLM